MCQFSITRSFFSLQFSSCFFGTFLLLVLAQVKHEIDYIYINVVASSVANVKCFLKLLAPRTGCRLSVE